MGSKLPSAKNDISFLSQNVRLFLMYKRTLPPLALSCDLDIKLWLCKFMNGHAPYDHFLTNFLLWQ